MFLSYLPLTDICSISFHSPNFMKVKGQNAYETVGTGTGCECCDKRRLGGVWPSAQYDGHSSQEGV